MGKIHEIEFSYCPKALVWISRFQTPVIYDAVEQNSMNNSESQSDNIEERKKDDTVLAQMGEDPGLPADVIEEHEDSKENERIDRGKNKSVTYNK